MYRAINAPGHVNNVVDALNATEKRYQKGKMELLGKLACNDTPKIGMIPSASKYVSIKFEEQCLHMINTGTMTSKHNNLYVLILEWLYGRYI